MIQVYKNARRAQVGAVLGNAVEYYDQSVYAYLAPFIAPIFFPTDDPVIGLIFTYLLLPIGLISRPMGAYIIGSMGDYTGRKTALMISVIGMGTATFAIGCLPTYKDVGLLSPCLLILCRIFQSFFVGAEFNGGAIYALEHTPAQRRGAISGLYSAGAVMGMLTASVVAWILSLYPLLTWRFPFYLSFLGAFMACYFRLYMKELPAAKHLIEEKISFSQLISRYRIDFLRVIGVAGLFNAIYIIPTVFLNTYIPIISNLSMENMLLLSSCGLAIYMGSLILFGFLSDRFSVKNVMKISSLSIIILSYPLFFLLYNVSLIKIFIFKGLFAILAGAFNGVFHVWSLNIFKFSHRYRGISLAYSLGSQTIGSSAPAICLWMWHKTHYVSAPSIYLIICGIIGFYCLGNSLKKT